MSKIEDFLSPEDQDEIVNTIKKSERTTSGEIRIHIERSPDKDIYEHAAEVFDFLDMQETLERNAVLIYVAIDTRELVILGDIGINDVVEPGFWESTKDAIISEFKKGDYKQGLIQGVITAGKQLTTHFPYKSGGGNELPDEITFG